MRNMGWPCVLFSFLLVGCEGAVSLVTMEPPSPGDLAVAAPIVITPVDAAIIPDMSLPIAVADMSAPPAIPDLSEPPPIPDLSEPPPIADLSPPLPEPPEVQEWGTYTSVQASDGHSLGGLHHEDEKLPMFVERRNWNDRQNYYFEMLPEEPLQQLETPVLYFWSNTAQAVNVRIDFPQGVVGQWYPPANKFAPDLGNCMAISGGWMSWDVTPDPSIAPASFGHVDPMEIWAPSRNVASTPVKGLYGKTEQFIFYRGLAKFDPPVTVVETLDDKMHLSNTSKDDLADTFVLYVNANGGSFKSLGALKAGATRDLAVPNSVSKINVYEADARQGLKTALVASGLKADVAQAMVDTWTRSWFRNIGLRVLYVAPRKWTDGWLPTKITPAPSAFVRTLVGRIETLTPADETALVATIRANAPKATPLDPATLGRFAEPRLRRALEALSDPTEKTYTKVLIDQAHALP